MKTNIVSKYDRLKIPSPFFALSLFFNFRLSHFEIYAKDVARKEQQHKTFCSRQIAWHKDEFLQRKVANHLSGLLRFRLEKSRLT